MGIIQFPVPILKGNTEILKKLRTSLFEPQLSELSVVDFSDLAQGCKTYNELIRKMANTSESRLNYIGIAVCGNKKQINKLTGSMPFRCEELSICVPTILEMCVLFLGGKNQSYRLALPYVPAMLLSAH